MNFCFYLFFQVNHAVEFEFPTNATEQCWPTLSNEWLIAISNARISITIITLCAYTTLFAIFTIKVTFFPNNNNNKNKRNKNSNNNKGLCSRVRREENEINPKSQEVARNRSNSKKWLQEEVRQLAQSKRDQRSINA